ncbi:hypothetical protein AAHA92_21688 [Salvia divinorum]|uniref:Protein FAR1-RELATED SEQUENCE n=1 Tax=Salvia divinorum TaxID=28513 RepID=A0ABD1GL93_SALDI
MHDSHEDAFDELLREGPKSDMMFDSETRLYEAYNSFAKKQGCLAHINATRRRDSGKWKVTTVHLGHNHDLDPNMSALMAGNRSLSMKMKRQLEANDIAGIRICIEEINKICNCNVKEVACIGEDDAIGVERFEVLVYKDVQHVNERYILRRWRKDVYRPHSSIVFTGGYPHMTAEYKEIQEMEQDFQQCVDLAGGSEEKMKFLKKRGKETKNALMNWRNPVPEAHASVLVEEGISPEILIGDPKVSQPRGRPKQKRFKSVVERNRSRGISNMGT